jgi:hypothetical protein
MQRMGVVIAAVVRESYCPTRKDFLAVSTTTELARRAKEHCENDAPAATGLSGKQVELKNECRAAFATGCGP